MMSWRLVLTDVLLLVLAVLLGFVLGQRHQDAAWRARQDEQDKATVTAMQDERARADALVTRTVQQQLQIDSLRKERQHEIARATTGQPCLRDAALRVLEHDTPGIRLVPEPASAAAAAPAAAAAAAGNDAAGADGTGLGTADTAGTADQRFATDTQVGGWIVAAGAAHKACVQQLDALIDWHLKEPLHQAATP